MKLKFTISNILILVSAVFTLLAITKSSYFQYGMNTNFLEQGQYHVYFIQLFTSQFLHGGLGHLFMNAVFIFIFGNYAEQILGEKKYICFFIFCSVIIGTSITFLSSGNTVGISGFAMAVMAYYTLHLKSIDNPDYKGGITALIINVIIGFVPGISLIGHLFGAISGALYFYILKIVKK